MIDPQGTYAETELSPQKKELLAKLGISRGYVPKGRDTEPGQAPTGAASTSTPASDDGSES